MRLAPLTLLAGVGMILSYAPMAAQSYPTDDPVIKAIWQEGMENSQAYTIAQVLSDSIGPRLSGSPAHRGGNEWAVRMFESWGIPARNEQYGTWRGWRRGVWEMR